MKNYQVCNNCETLNPLYAANCKSCNSYLHSKIANIDLWDSVWNIMTNPIETTVKLIQSEKKNFLVSLIILWFLKSSINNYMLKNFHFAGTDTSVNFSSSVIEGGAFSIILLLAAGFFITFIFYFAKVKTRIKDNITIISFALIPILLSFVFLTPFHFALYGFYWYTMNPSPFIIKPFVTYVLYGIEGIFIIWSLVLFVYVIYAQSNKLFLSIVSGIALAFILLGFHFLQVW